MLLSFVVLQWLFIMWRIEFRHQRAIACLAPPLSHPVLQPEWTRWYLGLAYPLQCQWLTPLLACRFPNSSLNLHSTCPGPFTSEPVIPSIFPDSGHSSPALGNLISPLGTCGYALPSAFVFIKYPCLMLSGPPHHPVHCSLDSWALCLVCVLLIHGTLETCLLLDVTEDSDDTWPCFAVHRHLFWRPFKLLVLLPYASGLEFSTSVSRGLPG